MGVGLVELIQLANFLEFLARGRIILIARVSILLVGGDFTSYPPELTSISCFLHYPR